MRYRDPIEAMRPVRRGGVVTWEPPDKPTRRTGRPTKPILHQWDNERLLHAHRAYNDGDHDPWTREGERVYNTRRRQERDASGRMSATDRAWCEKAVRDWTRIAWERANRAGGDGRLQQQIERTVV